MIQIAASVRSISASYWASGMGGSSALQLQSGVFSFVGREYLQEVMDSRAVKVCAMKASGGGFSLCLGVLPTLHGLIMGRYPQGALYVFPTETDVDEFSKSRFAPIIKANYQQIGKYVKNVGGGGSDTSALKRIGRGFLYLRGGRLQPGDEGSGAKKSTRLSGIQVDRMDLDEVDQMDSETPAKARKRMDAACVDGIVGRSEERYIANPSDVDRGIDLYWQVSDRREWYVKCGCGGWTCALHEFIRSPERCVGYYNEKVRRPDGVPHRGYVRCSRCGRRIGNWPGAWVVGNKGAEMVGYQWNHLASIFSDPARILEDFRNPPEGNIGDVYRLDLGLPYSASTDRLARDVVLRGCGPDIMADGHQGPCAMGVDIGSVNHVVIGVRLSRERYEIVKVVQVADLRDVHELARRYNVRSGVVDIGPWGEAQRVFQRSEPYKVYLCEYTESPLQEAVWNDNTGVVKVFRTGIFDKSHRLLTDGEIRLPRISVDIQEFARQCCNCVKSKKEDKRRQQIVFRYEATGAKKEDHYRNALNYFLLAAAPIKIAEYQNSSYGNRFASYEADNEYARI